jgi:hypothetical protein
MSKGSKPAGTTTSTTTNPTQAAQLPYLQQGWGSAQNLYNTTPVMPYYPGTTMAPFNPAVQTGYEGIYNTGAGTVAQGLQPNATGAFNAATTGGYGVNNSPAYGAYQQFMQGSNPYQQQLATLANSAAGGNLGLSQLGQTASGAYLGPNPYLQAGVIDPLTQVYRTSTAPTADYNYANAGRYGSGAMLNARSINEQDLGRSVGNVLSQNYSNERARQDAAAGQYSSQYNQGLTTAGNAIQNILAGQQYGATGLQSGYQAGNAAAMQALSQYPQFASAMFTPARAQLEAGQGLTAMDQATIADQMKRYYGEQNAPWDTLAKFMSSIGQYTSGSNTQTSPYFQNQTANALSGIAGTLGIGQQLFGGGGGSSGGGLLGSLGGMFGGGGAGAGLAAADFSAGIGETAAAASPELLSWLALL